MAHSFFRSHDASVLFDDFRIIGYYSYIISYTYKDTEYQMYLAQKPRAIPCYPHLVP